MLGEFISLAIVSNLLIRNGFSVFSSKNVNISSGYSLSNYFDINFFGLASFKITKSSIIYEPFIMYIQKYVNKFQNDLETITINEKNYVIPRKTKYVSFEINGLLNDTHLNFNYRVKFYITEGYEIIVYCIRDSANYIYLDAENNNKMKCKMNEKKEFNFVDPDYVNILDEEVKNVKESMTNNVAIQFHYWFIIDVLLNSKNVYFPIHKFDNFFALIEDEYKECIFKYLLEKYENKIDNFEGEKYNLDDFTNKMKTWKNPMTHNVEMKKFSNSFVHQITNDENAVKIAEKISKNGNESILDDFLSLHNDFFKNNGYMELLQMPIFKNSLTSSLNNYFFDSIYEYVNKVNRENSLYPNNGNIENDTFEQIYNMCKDNLTIVHGNIKYLKLYKNDDKNDK